MNTETNQNPNNIFFFLEEPPIEDLDDNNIFLEQIMQEFEEEEEENELDTALDALDSALDTDNQDYFVKKDIYFGNEELYYEQEYTVKDLMKICHYYDISKNIKASKCKKSDIVSTIVYYESDTENYDSVQRRHKLWSYMTELLNDPKMRGYVFW